MGKIGFRKVKMVVSRIMESMGENGHGVINWITECFWDHRELFSQTMVNLMVFPFSPFCSSPLCLSEAPQLSSPLISMHVPDLTLVISKVTFIHLSSTLELRIKLSILYVLGNINIIFPWLLALPFPNWWSSFPHLFYLGRSVHNVYFILIMSSCTK